MRRDDPAHRGAHQDLRRRASGAAACTAVEDVDLDVEEGEIFGFVGPNGAGKTTTIKMLMGLIYPTRGRAFIFDDPIPSQRAKARIGYLPEHPAYYEFLTGREALQFFARLVAASRARSASGAATSCSSMVGLADAADRQIRKYSKGMQQRLGHRAGAGGRPGVRRPGRADERARSRRAQGDPRPHPRAEAARQDRLLLDAHPARRRDALRSRRGRSWAAGCATWAGIEDLLSANVRSVELTAVVPAGGAPRSRAGRIVRQDGDRLTVVVRRRGARADAAVAAHRARRRAGALADAAPRHARGLLRAPPRGDARGGRPGRAARPLLPCRDDPIVLPSSPRRGSCSWARPSGASSTW